MKKVLFFISIIILSLPSFAQTRKRVTIPTEKHTESQSFTDPRKWAGWEYVTDGLPTKVRGIGDEFTTTAYLFKCPVYRDETGAINYPLIHMYGHKPQVSVYFMLSSGKVYGPAQATIVGGPNDAETWEKICVRDQSGQISSNGAGYTMRYSEPMPLHLTATVVDISAEGIPQFKLSVAFPGN